MILSGQKPFRNFKDYLGETPFLAQFHAYRDGRIAADYQEQIRYFEEE